ncbi:MAG: hypothetical protein JXP34_19635 [Planctomycetes bacterium]|nr:hypothetical protein [Planctomycetota bacterium]
MKGNLRAIPEILDEAAWLVRRRGHRLLPIYLIATLPPLLAVILAARELVVTGGAMTPTFERLATAATVLLVPRILGLGLLVELAQRFLRRDRESFRAAIACVRRAAPSILFAGAIAVLLPILAGFAPALGLPFLLVAGPLLPLAVKRPATGLLLPFHALRAWGRAAGLQLGLAAAAAVFGILAFLNAFGGFTVACLLGEKFLDIDTTGLGPFLSLSRPLARVAFAAVGLAIADLAWILLQTVLLFHVEGARSGEDLAAELGAIREDLGVEAS